MDQCTHEIRTAQWKKIIHNCQHRSSGKSIKQWLEENGILEQSYYYWQRKFRNEAYNQIEESSLPVVSDTNNTVSFVEVSAPVHQEIPLEYNTETIKPVAVIKTTTMSIAISNDISDQLLSKILQEVSHA